MSAEDLRAIPLFDGLTDDQLVELMSIGEFRDFKEGEELFREAQPSDYWWVLLEGTVNLSRRAGHEETVIGVMNSPGQWAGGFQAWDEHGAYLATARGVTLGRVLRVPAEQLRDLANAWFPFGAHLIRGLFNTVRSIENMARQREALVALGTLAAGLAHEMNNPASAATRSVDALEDSCEVVLSTLGKLADGSISTAHYLALDTLRREIEPQTANLEPLAIADREDALSDWLARHGVERDWIIAPPLAAAGLDVAWCERAAAQLNGAPLAPALEWIASSLLTASLLSEVKESTRRISDLVAAVKSYSQLDRASVQQTDLTEGIESTLVMLAHKLDGVAVVRDYSDDVPRIEAIAGELNQVWTNLIDNAIDTMRGNGTLRISTRLNDNGVEVEIGDTGPGMPKQVQARAFEPFYTTKDVGKGTGLGLDISRRIIVERHGGEITIDSRPGETVLLVQLPLRPATTR
jgi:signal transduction histidine kinase